MKFIRSLLLIALLVSVNGCFTSAAVQRARGYTHEFVPVAEGDKTFQHKSWTYVIQQKYASPSTNSISTSPSSDSDAPQKAFAYEPNAGYYLLVPLTIPADIALSPFYLIALPLMWNVH
jgi:hypothetical protein